MRQQTTFTIPRVKVRGFTLIEVMITVAIVAILAAVALPAYGDYVRRGQLPEAFSTLSDLRVKMEQYYQDNRRYGTSGANCADANTPAWATNTPNLTPASADYFDFSCALGAGTDQRYTLTATGRAGTRAFNHIYTIDETGLKQTTRYNGVDQAPALRCWAQKGPQC
jgi:type IV pilus assembly protein PilE